MKGPHYIPLPTQCYFPYTLKRPNKIPFEDSKNSTEIPNHSPSSLITKLHPHKITQKEYTLLPSNLLDDLEFESSPSQQPSPSLSSLPLIHPLSHAELPNILHKIQTYQGSLILQQQIQTFPPSQAEHLLTKLSPILINIMTSHYGNYFFQQLLQLLNKRQKQFIYSLIKQHFLSICTNKSGTYSIQALIDVIESIDEEQTLEQMITPILPQLCGNEHGHHIIIKLITVLPEERRSYINNFILKNLPNISCNKYGYLCVIKFIAVNTNVTLRVEFITQITKNFLCLIQNYFGCTIFIYLIEKFGIRYRSIIFTEMLNNMSCFATESNISLAQIEQVLAYLHKHDKGKFEHMIWEVCRDKALIMQMLRYKNGMRIIYYLLKYATQEQVEFVNDNYKV